MDFLDPEKKRARNVRLAIGHTLMVMLVLILTYILVYRAYGFDVDRQTGEVFQKGLVFIDSAPDDAQINVNGRFFGERTNTRLSLHEGQHTISLTKDGYRKWERPFELNGGEVKRFTYPILYPSDLTQVLLQEFKQPISLTSHSPDRRWILLFEQNNLGRLVVYDLGSKRNGLPASTALSLPRNLLAAAASRHKLTEVEWSNNNRQVLIKHVWPAGQEFVVVDRENPEKSFNLSRVSGVPFDRVELFNKSGEKFYLYDSRGKTLALFDLPSKTTKVVAEGVINFKSHGTERVLLAQVRQDRSVGVVLVEGAARFRIRSLGQTDKVPLELTEYKSDWYVVIGDNPKQRTFIYKNPQQFSAPQVDITKIATIILHNNAPVDDVRFSANAQIILSRSASDFYTYDAENKRQYNFQQRFDPGFSPVWMDGHRLLLSVDGKATSLEFDGLNKQTLVEMGPARKVMFNQDFTELYNLVEKNERDRASTLFNLTDLRLPGDQ